MFEMEGAENQPFPLNFDDKTNTILKESEHPEAALRLIILPFQAGRMRLPPLNVAKHLQPPYSERCCQGMAAVAAVANSSNCRLTQYILYLQDRNN